MSDKYEAPSRIGGRIWKEIEWPAPPTPAVWREKEHGVPPRRHGDVEPMSRLFWQVFHHTLGHGLVGLSLGRLWAWRLHDYSGRKGWPEGDWNAQRWPGLE